MNSTNVVIPEENILQNRNAVSDSELAAALGMGVSSARKIAEKAGAVFYIGRLRRNYCKKILDYIENELVWRGGQNG